MPRAKKNIHGNPEHYGIKNMPEAYADKNKDDLNTMEKILPIYHIGLKNRQDYKGLWNEEQLEKAIGEFFQYCAENDVKPAKVGLQLWLGIDKATYCRWQSDKEKFGFKSDLIQNANSMMEISYIQRGESYPTFNQFLLKAAHGMVETNKVEITNNSNTNTEEINEAINKLGLN